MAIGYFGDLAEANALIAAERLDTDPWDEVPSNPKKEACLLQAFNRIFYSKEFILPTLAEADVDELVVLKKAQAEMAFYLALHASDEDRRKGLQAQATTEAGIVKEKYQQDKLYDTPLPPFVRDLLCAYLAGDPGVEFGVIDLARDENESVHTKVHGY
jgi:hypothetical protein